MVADDVVISGAGPAGALAALILARAGLRVRVFERARFPRAKLCGDTLNPGALRILAQHVDLAPLDARALPIDGMRLTGPRGASVTGRYGDGITARAIERRDLDAWLVAAARTAGAVVEEGATVAECTAAGGMVTGVRVRGAQGEVTHQGRLIIGADGRRSKLAIALGLARQPRHPRRWAIGAYFADVPPLGRYGEMHVRGDHYIGVAPVPGGRTNACLVVPHAAGDPAWGNVEQMLVQALRSDAALADRFAQARIVDAPVILGPMAVDVDVPGVPGLLLAGDAAGFIDPITGDGLRFALAGGAHAAQVALDVLEGRTPLADSVASLAARRRRTLAGKWRFNRTVRRLVGSRRGVASAALLARAVPSAFVAVLRYAGDC